VLLHFGRSSSFYAFPQLIPRLTRPPSLPPSLPPSSPSSSTGLQGDEGLSKTDLGVVSSSFTVTYGASKFAGSVITGREGGREEGREGRHEEGNGDSCSHQFSVLICTTPSYSSSIFLPSYYLDHVSCRALFSLGLVLTGVLCFIFSLSSDLPRLCLLWSLHGVVQVVREGGREGGVEE